MHSPKEPLKLGVLIPTFRRPDLLRACVLQWLAQTLPPAVICVHQNGSEESYEWSVEDLRPMGRIEWIHSPRKLRQHQWYAVPLRHLIEVGCTHFFWSDHDDFYLRDHAQRCIEALVSSDFSVASHCGLLYVKPNNYRFRPGCSLASHAPGGMTSSSAFNRKFAQALLEDLDQDRKHHYADNVLAKVTLPKFVKNVRPSSTTIYVSHEGSQTSAHWGDGKLAVEIPFGPGGESPDISVHAVGKIFYGHAQEGYFDVTHPITEKCRGVADPAGRWDVPPEDRLRAGLFGDPASNQVKHLLVKGLPRSDGQLVDMIIRDQEACGFKFARGVLSVIK